MVSSHRDDDSALLTVATSIARGELVDWASAETTATVTPVIDALKALDRVAEAAQRMPDTWGRATITGELGRGACGTVYSAHDPHLGIEIALKVVRLQGVDHAARTVEALNEAKLLAQVNHPNVVRVFWAEAIGAEVGVAMELVRGRTLSDVLKQQGPLSPGETMAIGVDVCKALEAAHAANLIHGDVKAANVMRTDAGRTVLMDFGVGQDLKSGGSPDKRKTGTPLYLAPELFDRGERSPQSDIYSTGVLLFHLATNTYPIDADNARDVERHHAERKPLRRLRDLRPDLPDAFLRVVERAMAGRREDRHRSAAELGAALEQARRTRPRPFWIWPGALAATTGVLVVGLQYLESTPPRPQVAQLVAPSPGPGVTTPDDAYDIDVAIYRHENGANVRLTSGARVSPGDELSLRLSASVPVYAYVVNEDERGESYLLFPLPEHQVKNPLPPGTRHEIPGAVNGNTIRWQVSSAGGREHFLVFVTPQPPTPAFERMFVGLPRPVLGAPVTAHQLSPDQVVQLRGVGGLTKATPSATNRRLAEEFAVPLTEAVETVRGVWVRQLTLENPGK